VVIVKGEEDLAVLPLVEIMPDETIILYGQPGEGLVLCEVSEQLRQDAQKLLSYFVSA
jgi:hypothetical protein